METIEGINEMKGTIQTNIKSEGLYVFSTFSGFSNLIPPFTILVILVILLIFVLIFALIRMNVNFNSYFNSYFRNITRSLCVHPYAEKDGDGEKDEEKDEKKDEEKGKTDFYNKNMTYYVCSYGGCGSYMLCDYLRNFGKVEHIHSRNPPEKLTYVGKNNTTEKVYGEWFNNIKISKRELANYKVIYLYKDPVKAIQSRFHNPEHLNHIQCDESLTFNDILYYKKDLYKIEEFFDNYVNKSKKNYKIYCVKYEQFWENISLFNETLGLPDIKSLYPVKKETTYNNKNELVNKFYEIYNPLIEKMNKMGFLYVY